MPSDRSCCDGLLRVALERIGDGEDTDRFSISRGDNYGFATCLMRFDPRRERAERNALLLHEARIADQNDGIVDAAFHAFAGDVDEIVD